MELDRITLEKSFFNLSGQMTASPRASKLALFSLRLTLLLSIAHLKANATRICWQKQEELKDNRNWIQTTRTGCFAAHKGRNLPRSQVKFALSADECGSLFHRPSWVRDLCLFVCHLRTQLFLFQLKISWKTFRADADRIWSPKRILWPAFPNFVQVYFCQKVSRIWVDSIPNKRPTTPQRPTTNSEPWMTPDCEQRRPLWIFKLS